MGYETLIVEKAGNVGIIRLARSPLYPLMLRMDSFSMAFASEGGRESVHVFEEKRKPTFTGR
jgi:hypothetical protein